MESLRGMNGVVASSSTGWGVARFMLVVAAQRFVAARLELAENQAVAALLASPDGSFWWQRVLFYGTAGELFA